MRTVVLGPRPPELDALIEKRRARGQDLYDEVWEGEYHMTPAAAGPRAILDDELAAALRPLAQRAGLIGSGPFTLDRQGDFRVPDRGLHRKRLSGVWADTAALVVEILSPDDESFATFPFYAAHGVDEVLVADPAARAVRLWRLAGSEAYEEVDASALLGVTTAALAAEISWP